MTLRSPNQVGERIRGFAEYGLFDTVSSAVCRRCKKECDKPGCPRLAVLGHLENQVADAGIAFMKNLVKEWRS